MGCSQSKKKSKGKKSDKRPSAERDPCCGSDLCLEKQLERFEWQLRTLKEVLSANGNASRAELLKGHAHEEVCALVTGILDKVKTETTADLNVVFEQKRKAASEDHDRQIKELQTSHEQEVKQLRERFAAAEGLLKAQVEKLTSELQTYNALKRRVQESTLKRDLKRNVQTHGSPGEFWESEQESLLFVIEMKAEQVEEGKRRLQQMNQLTQKNLCLEEQLGQVLQQNEDLRVRFDNCQSVIQQLSAEQQELKLALDRQQSLNQHLSQQKEELVFKIRHRDSYPSMHLATMLPEIAPR
ncbi:unnamed protein product [Knipowitschia caucasica]